MFAAVATWTLLFTVSLSSFRETLSLGFIAFVISVLFLSLSFRKTHISNNRWPSVAVVSAMISVSILLAGYPVQMLTDNSGFKHPFAATLVLIFVGCLAACISAVVDPNQFSLHSLYKEGLIRTFLGASRSQKTTRGKRQIGSPTAEMAVSVGPRQPNPITNIDQHDDIPFEWLRSGKKVELPIFLMNATANGVGRGDTEQRTQREHSFTFNPYFCGSSSSDMGFSSTHRVFSKGLQHGITLGTAMAISGAAVTPVNRKGRGPFHALLLGIMNARLGLWIANPRYPDLVTQSSPKLAGFTILREMLGIPNILGRWINLSDGGHFDNLGVFELLRRGCRRIVVVDASCDKDGHFSDLANLSLRAKSELGIEIVPHLSGEVVLTDSRDEGMKVTGNSSWAWFDVIFDSDLPKGRILYVKPSIKTRQALPVEVAHYSKIAPDYPHETTLDQFFSDLQMEAYRSLGEVCMTEAMDAALGKLGSNPPGVDKVLRQSWFRRHIETAPYIGRIDPVAKSLRAAEG